MSDIFISYASQDRPVAQRLASALAGEGWSVWWDRTIMPGKSFARMIEEALDDTESVVVLWSEVSRDSDWVQNEARHGHERRLLIPVLIEDVKPPFEFRHIHAAPLMDWDGGHSHLGYRQLVAAISELCGPPPKRKEDATRQTEEAAAKRKAEEDAAARRKAEAEAAARRKAEDDAAVKRKAEEEAAAKRKAEEDAAAKRKAAQEAAAKRKAEDEKAPEAQAAREGGDPEGPPQAPPAAPLPRAKPSKKLWIAIGAAVIVLGMGWAVDQRWGRSTPKFSGVENLKPASVSETPPQTTVTNPRWPEIEALDTEMVVRTNANVRDGPGIEHDKVAMLSRGEQVKVTGHVEDWYRVALGRGDTGYVFKRLLGESKAEIGMDIAAGASKTFEPGETFRDCDVCPEMVVVPAGSFQMGSPKDEPKRNDDEGPQHQVTISKPFAVGVYELTFDEWDACVEDGGCNGYRPKDENWGTDRRPAINVGWNDAQAYVQWLSNKTGKSYRLLTEAEWEYAARAGTTTPFHFGSTISTNQANYDGNYTYNGGLKGEYRGTTMPVGSFQANGFGLHDVHGNVWEWVADCYDSDAYKTHKNYPVMVGGWQDSCVRVLRGGSWNDDPRLLRSANRSRSRPADRILDVGFRVARTLN